MKRIVISLSSILALSLILWNCTDKQESGTGKTLKESLKISSANVNNALSEIVATPGYQIFSMGSGGSMKSTIADSVAYLDSIVLGEINGNYNFQLSDSNFYCHNCFYKLFKRTGDNNNLVVSLPEDIVLHPYRLHHRNLNDTSLTNNFTITASDYHYYYGKGLLFDYKLAAGFTLDSEDIGSLDIQSASSSWSDYMYNSSYSFNNDYSIQVGQVSGDTTLFSFTLMQGSETLLNETVNSTKSLDSRHRMNTYQLTIGNVEIIRSFGSDSIAVYMNGTLQQNASVDFIDTSTDNGEGRAVCRRNRDIRITFDDGTVTTLSELIGPSLETLQSLSGSLQSMYFASNVVDYIAWNIFTGRIE